MQLYFAYGANMVQDDMDRRCPAARLLGAAILDHYRFAITRSGYGTVLRQAGARVHGVLWRLARGDEAALDRFEEVERGRYRRAWLVVRRNGRPVTALVYIAAATEPGRPSAAYIGAILASARRFGFPAGYVAALDAIARTASGVSPASRNARSVSEGSLLA
ncbi:MAG TPA: gamma-glutamylcyclotransferase family protein [Stellaceae bacterium]|nr:gamma-glutamylcyclotransferase family protein [Stellaceae bacterium]